MKIKLTKTRNIPCNEAPEEGKDYLISLRCFLKGVFQPAKAEPNDSPEATYQLEIMNVEQMLEIGGHELKIQKGYTPSQKLRYSILDWASRTGVTDKEDFYEKKMEALIKMINEKDV